MHRRKFLGAAAALASLPASISTSAAEESGESAGDDANPGYGVETVAESVGNLMVYTAESETVEVTVGSHPEGVNLSLESPSGRMGTMLLPEDVEQLVRELTAAVGRTQESEVEQARRWVTAEFKGGADGS